MGTGHSLLARAMAPEGLAEAWKRVATKRAAGGADGVSVQEFGRDLDASLEVLRRDVLDGRYVPQPLQQITIPKPGGGGEHRTLHLPSVRDKVAQQAVRAAVEPILDRRFLDCSYGYRLGKGPARAVGRVNHHLTSLKQHWVVVADIDDFFGSLDQTLLIDRLREVVPDEGVLRLVGLWLRMGAVDRHGRWRDVYSGVGQGGVISPLLANFYLHPFDEHMVQAGFSLIRYADNFVVLCRERSEAEAALVTATAYLEQSLRLRLNPQPRPISNVDDGFSFLGVLFVGQRRLVESDKIEKIREKIARIVAGDPERALRGLSEGAAGWRHYYGALVDADEMAKLQQLAIEGLAKIVACGLRRGPWRNADQASQAIESVELVTPVTGEARRQVLAQAVHDGKALAACGQPTGAKAPTPPARAGKRRGRRRALGAKRSDSVDSAVRRAKRDHHRNLAQVSELVVSTPGAFLGKTSERVVVRQDRRNVCEIPTFRLTGITVASRGISLSADLIVHCAEHDIPVLFLTPQGKVAAVLSAPESSRGAVGLLQLQAVSASAPAVALAAAFVEGKIRNQLNLLKYLHKYRKRTHPDFAAAFGPAVEAMRSRLGDLRAIRRLSDLETARGQLFSVEGRAAQEYWALVGLALRGRVEFPGRQRQGARDLVNSLLNYSYAVLQARVHLALLRAGLAPQISFLHTLQPKGQPTLVFDLMEEFRSQVVDRSVLTLFGRRQPLEISPDGWLTEDTRRRLIRHVYDRLATLVRFRGKELKLDEVIQHQAHLLVRHLKGEAKYRPFVAKW
jgi:group II intron reverse transcriptase/maturase/CRISPR-associated endonuclease Cas1